LRFQGFKDSIEVFLCYFGALRDGLKVSTPEMVAKPLSLVEGDYQAINFSGLSWGKCLLLLWVKVLLHRR